MNVAPAISEAVARCAERLAEVGIESARTEAELLVGAALDRSRDWLFLHPDEFLSAEQQAHLAGLLARRAAREPLPYILGRAEFCGLSFRATPAAIVPRPETEILVEAVVARAREVGAEVAVDVGTGCGAIAVALAKQLSEVRVIAIDTSPEALRLARDNCRAHGVADRVALVGSDLLSAIRLEVDCVVANLPYIRSDEFPSLQPEVRDWEPRAALDGGEDGLEVIRRFSGQLLGHLRTGGFAGLEVGTGQAGEVAKLLRAGGLGGIEVLRDYGGIERVVIGWRGG